MKDLDRLDRWLSEREADTGDILYYQAPRFHETQKALVIRKGKHCYEIMAQGRCYYEDPKDVIPVSCMRLAFPPTPVMKIVPVFYLHTDIEKNIQEKPILKRVK
jgi:hypothetical protein